MKAYSLLYLSLCSFGNTLCVSVVTYYPDGKERTEKLLEDSQPKSEEEAFENFTLPPTKL